MNKNLITEKLKKLVKPYVPEGKMLNNINEDTNLIKDLEINSINLIDVILDIELEFGIEIDNASMEKMTTVGSAIDIIMNKLEQPGTSDA